MGCEQYKIINADHRHQGMVSLRIQLFSQVDSSFTRSDRLQVLSLHLKLFTDSVFAGSVVYCVKDIREAHSSYRNGSHLRARSSWRGIVPIADGCDCKPSRREGCLFYAI